MPGLEPFHVRQIRMVERVLGQKVSPRDHAMIDCLAERMERYGWHSVSINPGPLGYQYIIQAKSEKRREDEARQRAAQDAAQPQPTATFAAAPSVEEVVAMALDLCERWRAEQARCRRVHAAQRLSRDPGPSHSRSRSRSPNSCRSSVSGCDEG